MPAPRIRDTKTGVRLLEMRRRAFNEAVERLSGDLRAGTITLEDWRASFRQELKDLHSTAMIIARGGERGAITQADWGRVGGRLRGQYRYLDNFAQQIKDRAEAVLTGGADDLQSQAYLAWRSKLYGGNAQASFWQSLAYGLLPQVPGDGKTICRTNCQCTLRFEETDDPYVINVYWDLNPAEHCDDCVRLNQEWNPYVLILPPDVVEAAVACNIDLLALFKRVVEG